MNYLTSFKNSFEKSAGLTTNVAKTIIGYPGLALAGLAGVGAVALALKIANKTHPLHQMVSEQQKKSIIRDQREILGQILAEQKKQTISPIKTQKLIIPPLA